MDHRGLGYMKIAQILPEFHEGGVERHVLWLSGALAGRGHQVTVISAGGKLEDELDPRVSFQRMPVHLKDPFAGLYSALKIAAMAKRGKWDILHSHSRVPAWIAWWASSISGNPWVFTAHDRYRKNWAIGPFKKADGSICVSEAVRSHLSEMLPERTVVIRNGIPFSGIKWQKDPGMCRKILFVGRLTERKGLHVAMEALGGLMDMEWSLDIVGNGPGREGLEVLAGCLGIRGRVSFHGYQDNPEEWMSDSDFLIFPSLDEGMGLVLMQAIRIGMPFLASDIEPVRELVGKGILLVKPGDVSEWRSCIGQMISEGSRSPRPDTSNVPAVHDMAASVSGFYQSVINSLNDPCR